VADAGPGQRQWVVMAYDVMAAKTLLLGGFVPPSGIVVSDPDLWKWDGAAWSKAAAAAPPPARCCAGMVYDSARHKTVLFGGANNGSAIGPGSLGASVYGATWEWDGAGWAQVADGGPSARDFHAMVFDSARGKTVLYGGQVSGTFFADTWEWDGTSWAQVGDGGPGPRAVHAMAYDSARGQTILFGGWDGQQYSGETWGWDGAVWTLLARADAGPGARGFHGMAYDSARRRAVLFGGETDMLFGGADQGDTWEWDGTAWKEVPDAGLTPRDSPGLAYDSARGRTVLFGGWNQDYFGDTWEYVGPPVPSTGDGGTAGDGGTGAGGGAGGGSGGGPGGGGSSVGGGTSGVGGGSSSLSSQGSCGCASGSSALFALAALVLVAAKSSKRRIRAATGAARRPR
jgi:hypothetical protein